MDNKCSATTLKGTRCSNKQKTNGLCNMHASKTNKNNTKPVSNNEVNNISSSGLRPDEDERRVRPPIHDKQKEKNVHKKEKEEKEGKEEKQEETECCVCYDKTKHILRCKHGVCEECLEKMQNILCPMCRCEMDSLLINKQYKMLLQERYDNNEKERKIMNLNSRLRSDLCILLKNINYDLYDDKVKHIFKSINARYNY